MSFLFQIKITLINITNIKTEIRNCSLVLINSFVWRCVESARDQPRAFNAGLEQPHILNSVVHTKPRTCNCRATGLGCRIGRNLWESLRAFGTALSHLVAEHAAGSKETYLSGKLFYISPLQGGHFDPTFTVFLWMLDCQIWGRELVRVLW